jgi:serine/threonine protein kinase
VSALKICPTCGTEYPASERFCPRDGTALRAQGGGSDLVGSILAERYHVLRKLGEGGMGQVYLAEHVKMGRRSAVKVMHPAMVHDADALGRFNREAANASRINHPNVAGIYDFGETPDGLVYLAMEFVQGETLTELLKATGALSPGRAAEITRQTAEALHVAHEMGIVHRDLKPDNIMITKDHDGRDCVKVVDFGIAKAAGSEAQDVTRQGVIVGTPEYMSPEQLSGDTVDGRSDVYSLGLVAFTMLTGTLPFPSETSQSSMIMRLTEAPRRLSEMKRDVRWPDELQAVLDTALARDVTARYQKAREFGRALVDAVGHLPARAATSAGTIPTTALATSAQPDRVRSSTRVLAATPTIPARRGRSTRMIGAAVVLAVIAAGVVMASGTRALRPAGVPKRVVASVGTLPVSPPPVSAPIATVDSTVAPATAGAAAVLAATPVGDTAAMARELRTALAHASDESTARTALSEADQIATHSVVAEDRAMLAMIRAQAYGTLGEDARSCESLREGVAAAKGTAYESRFTGMLSRCR